MCMYVNISIYTHIYIYTEQNVYMYINSSTVAELHPEYVARVAAVHEEVRDYMQARSKIAAQGYAN